MIRWFTAGESHGKGLLAIIDGFPAGVRISENSINKELKKRQSGYGRGKRMDIEHDKVEILSGVRFGRSIGSPITLSINNEDYKNWKNTETLNNKNILKVTKPRPGHADLPGALKYRFDDIRNVSERASARETAARVAVGSVFKSFLEEFGITIYSHTISIGSVKTEHIDKSFQKLDESPLRCMDTKIEDEMVNIVNTAKEMGDTVGGVTEIRAKGVCPGLGSYAQFDRRLDARIGQVMLSIPSVKGIEIGSALENTLHFGSRVHDEIFYEKQKGFYRKTNHAGGIEGGISNGEEIVIKLMVKPIPTLKSPLHSVDISTKQEVLAQKERADICVVPAVGIIGEAMLAFVIADAVCEKFGGDSISDMKAHYELYKKVLTNE